MTDSYNNHPQDVSATAAGVAIITPADGVDLANSQGHYPTAFYLGAAQTLAFKDMFGNDIVADFGAGWHPIRISELLATGTDAATVLMTYQANPVA